MNPRDDEGTVYGMRHLDFFFSPRFRMTENGIELLKKKRFVRWGEMKKIRRCDNAIWRLTRGPLGAYLYYDDRTFWISARIIKHGASVRKILAASFSHLTKDYQEVLRKIEDRIQITQPISEPYSEIATRFQKGLE